MNWKFTDASGRVVFRTNANGSQESCLVSAIADWVAQGNTILPADVPVPLVPQSVTMRQARLALLQNGLLDTVNSTIAGMTGTQGQAAQIEWQYSSEVMRHKTLVQSLGPALGLTEAQLDQLFITAATL